MTKEGSLAFLFPGQGSFYPGVLREVATDHPEIRSTLEQMNDPVRELLGTDLTAELLDRPTRTLDQWLDGSTDLLQVALVAIDIASYRALRADGLPGGMMVGHSLGELAALTCAGFLSVEQAARVACARAIALRESDAGGLMVALGTPGDRARALRDLIADDGLAVAVENAGHQTVVSGPGSAARAVTGIAQILGISAVTLKSPYAFHSPVAATAARRFFESIRPLRPLRPEADVFSPILGRFYRPDDDLAALLAEHLTRPVRFGAAVGYLRSAGVTTFVEAGALGVLGRLVRANLDDPAVRVVTPLPDHGHERESWAAAVDRPAPNTAAAPPVAVAPAAAVAAPPSTTAPDRDRVLAELVTLYSEALEYPEEVFEADTDLEAELGVDSVKQTELLGRVSVRFGLPAPDAGFRVAGYPTLAAVAELVVSAGSQQPLDTTGDTEPTTSAPSDRASIVRDLVSLYAQALEYPEEVFEADTDLEAELGVDSVKQTELLARVSERYRLPAPGADFRMSDHGTIARIADLVARTSPAGDILATAENGDRTGTAATADEIVAAVPLHGPAHPLGTLVHERDEILRHLVDLYARALEYPTEVFEADTDLEAELGVDSVKQTELLARVRDDYRLPAPGNDFRLSHYGTLSRIADLVQTATAQQQRLSA